MTHFLCKPSSRLKAPDFWKFICNGGIRIESLSTLPQNYQRTGNQTVDYLVNSLGLSQHSALAAANRIHLKRTANPDSVLAVFKSYGFTPPHIASIFSRNPSLLFADPNTILKPKLEFLSRNGVSGEVLVDVISKDPSILRRSLDKQIAPCIEFLKSFFGSTKGLISLFSVRRGTWVLHKFSEFFAPNVELLRAHGVPNSNITKMICVRPRTLSRDAEEFSEFVEVTKKMGFNPSSLMFIYGLCTLSGMKKDKWMSKLNVFKSFGWSEEQFYSLFVKQPKFMNSSEEQITRALDFFMNKLDWTAEEIYKYPIVLFLSFEKRVIPRSSILQHLMSKGSVKKTCIGKAFMISEDMFLVKFVMQHLADDPHLLEMYQKKMAIS